jgi:hypothetical protein
VALKPDSILFLLGAGASREAGIPTSIMMIDNIEKLLEENREWSKYKELYYCIKSSIIHGFGIIGDYDKNLLNIETLVNTMDELIKSIKHPIYPFVGSWIPRLTELTNNNFTKIEEFRRKIVAELYRWMKFQQNEDILYNKGFLKFQDDYKYTVRIFSLNYDTCIEEACGEERINRGFDPEHKWDWRNFGNEEKSDFIINLYKLHGSRDWAKTLSGTVIEKKGDISEGEEALIFGTTYKLQYLDPFLYLIYEFRQWTLDPKTEAIVCIGYSFGDEHINGIIKQSIIDDSKRKIVVVSPLGKEDNDQKCEKIMRKIGIKSKENILYVPSGAKDFLDKKLSVDFILNDVLPKEKDPF